MIMFQPIRFLGLLVCCLATGLPVAASAPNIVVLLSDDMNAHYPGFQGGPVATPHLDQLAREGTSLSQFYVHAVCSPTRAAFLTGRYPFRNGMEDRAGANDIAGLLPDERTLGEAMQQAGYETALIGKWHLGNWFQRQLPRQRGFDHHYGHYGALVSYYDKVRGGTYDWHRNGITIRDDGYTTDLLASEFERILAGRAAGRPFFYFVAFNATHGPDEAPEDLIEKYRRVVDQQAGTDRASMREFRARKYAMLESMDSAIGRMIEALAENGYLENTLIVFFNDNGGRHENLPFRGGKGQTYEGGVRVPCLFYWPGHVPAGKSIDAIAHAVDLYPTLLGLAGGSVVQPLPLDGQDLWPTITAGEPSPREEVVLGLPGQDVDTGEMAIRLGPWKLVGASLFHLESDPREQTDVAKERPEIYRRLRARIDDYVTQRRASEEHAKIPVKTLWVYGEDENANPPAWLPTYLEQLPPSERERRREK